MLVTTAVVFALSLSAGPESLCLPDHADAQRAYEESVRDGVSPARLREMHETLASEPHRAGTPGDERVIRLIASHFDQLGLEVEVHRFDAYLPEPGTAHLELVSPVRRALETREAGVEGDEYSQRAGRSLGWNGYSGTGDVTAGVVYVNRGTLEDFAALRDMGVSVRGKIAIARYGGNFRGYKAKYAEEAGAVGLIIYTDPGDSGYARGPMWPEGGWANEWYIQSGSILTLDYAGDPLTPGAEATPDAPRLDPAEVDLPRIPVQPIGWGAAQEILSRLDGAGVPDEAWQGALPFPYRVTGDEVLVRLSVTQPRRIVRSANVIGTLRGVSDPDATVLIGAHHDAWEYGAHDPLSGTIAVLEAARVFAELTNAGSPPARTLKFCAWGAEEYGIIGSTEWVEANEDELMRGAVAYFNLDAASGGLRLGASASPSLKELIASAADGVASPASEGASAFEEWSERGVRFGDLGGGSDHVGFYTRVGVPSAGIGARGASGSSYHSVYDNLAWYQRTVGDDYASAALVTKVTAVCAARLANASLLAVDLTAYGVDALRHAEGIEKRASELGVSVDLSQLRAASETFAHNAAEAQEHLREAVSDGRLDGAALSGVNSLLRSFERLWLAPEGLSGRPWYRNLFASSDPTSGYAAWMLPEIRAAVEARDEEAARDAVERTATCLRLMNDALSSLRAMVPASE